jgi:hypothetical protein
MSLNVKYNISSHALQHWLKPCSIFNPKNIEINYFKRQEINNNTEMESVDTSIHANDLKPNGNIN